MSHRKDMERTKQFLYRGGLKVPRSEWDRQRRELKRQAEEQRLRKLGLVSSKPKLLVAELSGLKKRLAELDLKGNGRG